MGGFIPGEEIKIIQPVSLCPETSDICVNYEQPIRLVLQRVRQGKGLELAR